MGLQYWGNDCHDEKLLQSSTGFQTMTVEMPQDTVGGIPGL